MHTRYAGSKAICRRKAGTAAHTRRNGEGTAETLIFWIGVVDVFISKKDFDALCERVRKLEDAETARAEDLRRQEEYERSMQRQFENMLAYDGSDQTARGDE